VQRAGARGQRPGHGFDGAGRREAAEADERAVGDQLGRLLRREVGKEMNSVHKDSVYEDVNTLKVAQAGVTWKRPVPAPEQAVRLLR